MSSSVLFGVILALSLNGRMAMGQLVNPSFELPTVAAGTDELLVPTGWNADNFSNNGPWIEHKAMTSSVPVAYAGQQYLEFTGNVEVWQNSGMVMSEGVTYVFLAYAAQSSPSDPKIKISIYAADDASSKGVEMTSATGNATTWTRYSVAYTCDATHAGKYVTVVLKENPGCWVGFDKVSLVTKYDNLVNPSFESPIVAAGTDELLVPDGWNADNASGYGPWLEHKGMSSSVPSAFDGTQYMEWMSTVELWQNSGLMMYEGVTYTFSAYGAVTTSDSQVKIALSTADDAGSKGVEVALTTGNATIWTKYSVSYTCDAAHAGKYLTVVMKSSGSWIGFDKASLAIEFDRNKTFNVPAISAIYVDGDLSDWSASSDWSNPFVFWNAYETTPPLISETQAKFAWNDVTDTLYVAIRTNEGTLQAGGHLGMGFSKNIDSVPTSGVGSTQLGFDPVADCSTVTVMNEIQWYKDNAGVSSWGGGGTSDVHAAYQYDSVTGFYTYEISLPLWTDWRLGQMMSKQTLSPGDAVYLYATLESVFRSGNGTDLSYYGNPAFYLGAFDKATVLTLLAPTVVKPSCDGSLLVNPLAYYSFDDAANLGADGSGHNYTATAVQNDGNTDPATVVGGVTYGYFGGSSIFPAISGNNRIGIKLPVASIPADQIPTTGFSVSAWVNMTSTTLPYEIFSATTSSNTGNPICNAEWNPGKGGWRLMLRNVDSGGTVNKIIELITPNCPPTAGQWTHVVFEYSFETATSTGKALIYVNGQEAGSTTTLLANYPLSNSWDYAATFGITSNDWGRQFEGQMDEAYVFNRALAPVEVKILAGQTVTPGDANGDGKVDVGDLGILAANYGLTSGATWPKGDFNKDGKVDVGDLGILAANYGSGASGADFNADYAKVFSTTAKEDASDSDDADATISSLCSGLGLSLITGLALMGLMLVKLEE
jgi:hypothetical protein